MYFCIVINTSLSLIYRDGNVPLLNLTLSENERDAQHCERQVCAG